MTMMEIYRKNASVCGHELQRGDARPATKTRAMVLDGAAGQAFPDSPSPLPPDGEKLTEIDRL
jgi:hypothetical protein